MLFMFVRALSYKQFIHVIARTVPLTFKLTKVKMHKTRWGQAFKRGIIKDKTRQGTSALRAVCKYHRFSPRKVDCYTAYHDEICGF